MKPVMCVVAEVDRAVIDGAVYALDNALDVICRHDGPVTVDGITVSVDRVTTAEAARFLECSAGGPLCAR